MSYEPETKKVELDERGGLFSFKKRPYAVFYVELRHGTQKAVNALTRPFLKFPGKPPTLSVKGEGEMTVEGDASVDIDLTAISWDEVNDAIIVGQVKEWSFGPVDQATLNELPEQIRGRLVNECNLLYGKLGPLAKGGGGN